ncbi:fungal specific transcription factor domain-containing protein [Phanerochaete sordida]|uniref:Fungal specific transcription factor domain-containing protein n=1 Tax=Phanerochaete sordida TaxID=48140 RepID=A0A9P3LF56_9APHY|nr:fungal specific transcription factor domain-containing protein [Phanerochaete sordida]
MPERLSAGQGTRFVLADTEQLHRKIAEMSERIRQLEDALAIFQAGISTDRHPLLRDELLTIKFGPEVRRTVDDEYTRNALSQSIDALGTLTIGEHGETKYIGRSGGSETLFLANNCNIDNYPSLPAEVDDIELDLPDLSEDVNSLAFTFPFSLTPESSDAILDKLESYLPPQPRAWALCETYLEQFTWWFRPIKRDELINEILIPIYRTVADPSKHGYHRKMESESARCPHLLATLFMVLSVGALVDLTLSSCSAEAEKYYRLGRTALSLRSVFDSPELETVQAVGLMAGYHSLCSFRYTLESAWALGGLASKLAQSIGLHRDSAQWKLDDKIVQRRRNLFWELFIFEIMHCLALGRPPSIALKHIDCEIPTDEESSVGENGHVFPGYWKWRFLFSQQVYAHIVDALVNAQAPTYETVLDLDRRIRQTTLPAVRLYLQPDEDDYNNPGLCMKGYLMSQYRSISMIYIHRTFFAQALLDHPDNPLSSPYAPSFLAANRCASVLIKSFIHYYERCPDLIGRFWGIWTHAFSAAIILGSTVYRAPSVSMAASALVELELVIELFGKGCSQSFRARQAYAILRELKNKADRVYQQYRNRHASPALDIQLNIGPEAEISASRLAIFGGQTRVMSSKLLSRRRPARRQPSQASCASSPTVAHSDSPPRDTSPGATTAASTPSDSGSSVPQNVSDAFAQVHPSLVEYLALIPSSASLAVVDPPTAAQLAMGADGRMNGRMNGNGMNGGMNGNLDGGGMAGMNGIEPTATTPTAANGLGGQTPVPAFQGMSPSFQQFFADMQGGGAPAQQQQAQPQMAPGDFFGGGATPDAGLAALSMPDLGFTEDVMMTDHWMNLMRQTGILDSSGNYAAVVPPADQGGAGPAFSF